MVNWRELAMWVATRSDMFLLTIWIWIHLASSHLNRGKGWKKRSDQSQLSCPATLWGPMLTLDFTSCDRLVDGSYMGLHGVTISHIYIYISYIDIIYTYIDNIYIYIVKVYLLDFDSSRMPTVGIKISSIHPTIFSTFSCAFTNVYTACCCASDSPRLRDKTAGVPIPKARPFLGEAWRSNSPS